MNTLNTLELVDVELLHFTNLAIDLDGLPYTPLELLVRMRTVLAPWRSDDGITFWSARAQGCENFATGKTVLIAMQRALVLHKFGPTVTLPSTAPPPNTEDCADLFG